MSPADRGRSDPLHIPSLDGIRALSFFIVFLAHAGLSKAVPGGFGVTAFFFLSGYLITTLLRIEHERSGTISFKRFYLRRALRILPPIYLALALALAGVGAGWVAGPVAPGAVAAQALHFTNYWIIFRGEPGMAMGTGVYWSLAVEEHFYFLFPLLFVGLRRFGGAPARQALVLWGLCAAILVWRCVLVFHFHVAENRTYMASDTRFDSLLYGCALAIYGNPVLDGPSRLPERLWKRALVPAAVAALLFTFVYRQPAFRETFRYSVQGIALTVAFIAAIRFPGWGFFRLLNRPAVAFVGVMSYSLYLVHHVVLGVASRLLAAPPALQGAAALLVSFALSYAIYRVVEVPCARLRKRLGAATGAVAPAPAPADAPVAVALGARPS
jgi:peptidoglycan/LPS O-acetylase OafA/YrhL